ncbi:MAG: DUF4224 domain-containing protein [Telluria sp.]
MEQSHYLSADELAELIDCKPNQRSKMIAWLVQRRWRFEISSTGLPRVARAYHDRKMGISEESTRTNHADAPNLDAFAERTNRDRPPL